MLVSIFLFLSWIYEFQIQGGFHLSIGGIHHNKNWQLHQGLVPHFLAFKLFRYFGFYVYFLISLYLIRVLDLLGNRRKYLKFDLCFLVIFERIFFQILALLDFITLSHWDIGRQFLSCSIYRRDKVQFISLFSSQRGRQSIFWHFYSLYFPSNCHFLSCKFPSLSLSCCKCWECFEFH